MSTPNGDLIVILPGILGSKLQRGGSATWGYRQVIRNFDRLSERLYADLALPAGAFSAPDVAWNDGTIAPAPIGTLAVIPGFWRITHGYERITSSLQTRFSSVDNVVILPYDWRQSNRVTANYIHAMTYPMIRRLRMTKPSARIQFVCHSMGGLAASYFAEILDTERYTRRIVTIGTPFDGAAKAYAVLAGDHVALGPMKFHLGKTVRTFPSVAELLPMYGAFGPGCESLVSDNVDTVLPRHILQHGVEFHRQLRAARRETEISYVPIVGISQATDERIFLDGGRVAIHPNPDPHQRGDGTVPRVSAIPSHWRDGSAAHFVSQRHGSIHAARAVIEAVYGAMTDIPRTPATGIDALGANVPDFGIAGEPVDFHATAGRDSGSIIRLDVWVGGRGRPPKTIPMRRQRGGEFFSQHVFARPGIYEWSIRSGPGRTARHSIHDAIFIVDPI